MKILNIETRSYDNCKLIDFNYSTVYNIILLDVIYYSLYDMNFKDSMNCISSNDRLVDCVLKCKKNIAPYFMRKDAKAIKAVTQ